MAGTAKKPLGTKRKRDEKPAESEAAPVKASTLTTQADIEEPSDDDDGQDPVESSSDAESFPEINESDDEDEEDLLDGRGDDESSDGSYLIEDSDFVDSIDSEEEKDENGEVNTGPKARTVISKITGRPKRVYPEIEPDYDSDSSTEEV